MPVIDLGSVVGPQGPQGATGATGATGAQGPVGPNQITTNTSTSLSGILTGINGFVGRTLVDTNPTADSPNLITSGAVFARAGGIYTRRFDIAGANNYMRIPSTEEAIYILAFERRSGTKEPYLALVSYFLASTAGSTADVNLVQITTNAISLAAVRTSASGNETGLKITMPTYCAGIVISNKPFELNFTAT